jgi:hypothetical protein
MAQPIFMETTFYIVLSMRTVNGFEPFSKFFVGNDRDFACTVFGKLKGDKNRNNKGPLRMELMETRYERPISITRLSCPLEEMAENFKILVREIFKHLNLGQI